MTPFSFDPTTHASLAVANLTRLGIGIPEGISQAIRRADALAAAYAQQTSGTPTLGQALIDALDRGDDPLTDDGVRRALAHRVINAEGVGAFTLAQQHATFDAFTSNADDLIGSLVPVFGEASAAITLAAQLLGDTDRRDVAAVGALSIEARAAWAASVTAIDHLETIRQAWAAIIRATGRDASTVNPLAVVIRPDTETWFDGIDGQHDVFALARAGAEFDLAPTFDDAQQRTAEILTAREARTDAADTEGRRGGFAGADRNPKPAAKERTTRKR